MKINGNTPPVVRPNGTTPVSGPTTNAPGKPAAATRQPGAEPRTDSVRISDAGRALAQTVAKVPGEGLTAARTAELRQRVLSGAYNSTAMVDQVARRILDKGDA